MGRQSGTPKAQIAVRIPEDLVERVRTKLADPVRNKTKYGSIADLLTAKLYEWLQEDDVPLNKLTKE